MEEEQPLGTAGAVSLLAESKEPLLVINGDILTKVDFNAMLDFHCEQRADMTVAVKPYEVQVPYGVVEVESDQLVRMKEKPTHRVFVNAGIYTFEKQFIENEIGSILVEVGEKFRSIYCYSM